MAGTSSLLHRHWLIVLLVLVLVAGGAAWWTLLRTTAPTLLGDRTGIGFLADPQPVDRAAEFAAVAGPDSKDPEEVLTFNAVPEVHFRTNTARATARVAICVRAKGELPMNVGPASDIDTSCRQVRAVERGTRLRWADSRDAVGPKEYLILVVTPTKPGTVTLDRITYDYDRGSRQSGRDTGTLEYTIRAT